MRVESTALEQFLHYVTYTVGSARTTIYTYRSHLTRFLAWNRNGNTRLSPRLAGDNYIASLRASGLSNTTIQSHLNSLGAFFRWYRDQNPDAVNPFAHIRRPKREMVQRIMVPEERVTALIEGARRNPYWLRGYRDPAIIATMAYAGLRRHEPPGLMMRDYELVPLGANLHVLGKGNKRRIVPCPQILIEYIDSWIEVRGPSEGPLFLSVRREGLHPKAIPPILEVSAKLAGIEPIRCHELRHFYASYLLGRDVGIQHIKEVLGHASVATTATYLHADLRHLRAAVIGAFEQKP